MIGYVKRDWAYEKLEVDDRMNHTTTEARMRKADGTGIRGRGAEGTTASWATSGRPQGSPRVTRRKMTWTRGRSGPTWANRVTRRVYGTDPKGIVNQPERGFGVILMELIPSLGRNESIKTLGASGLAAVK